MTPDEIGNESDEIALTSDEIRTGSDEIAPTPDEITPDEITTGSDGIALEPVQAKLAETFEDVVWEHSHGQVVAHVPRETWYAFAEAAKEAGFEVCADVTAVDWLRSKPQRYQVVASLLSMEHRERVRMITSVDREDPSVDSITPIWQGAGYAEREVYDMFGIRFDGHPDLTRILMPDDWEGHPLRKDYGVGSVPVQFKQSHQVS